MTAKYVMWNDYVFYYSSKLKISKNTCLKYGIINLLNVNLFKIFENIYAVRFKEVSI